MFTELYAVAKHTPLQISVSPDGVRLNVLIIPKPGDDADEGSALTKPIQAIGTPEELDRELPAKLAEYCAAINDLRLKIDMPIEAITAEAGKGGGKKSAKPAAKKAVPKPAPKPAKPARSAAPVKAAETIRRERRTQELAAGRTAAKEKAAAAQKPMPDTKGDSPRTGDSAPGVVTSGNERPSGSVPLNSSASAAAPADSVRDNSAAEIAFAQARRAQELAAASAAKKSKRASREACIADLRTYLAECANTNTAITRALFLSHNATGRSYERKFKSWEEFLAEGRKAPDEWENKFPLPGDGSPEIGNDKPGCGNESPQSRDDAPGTETTMSQTVINPALRWPFPTGAKPTAPAVDTTKTEA